MWLKIPLLYTDSQNTVSHLALRTVNILGLLNYKQLLQLILFSLNKLI
jgi:hypothetical protein